MLIILILLLNLLFPSSLFAYSAVFNSQSGFPDFVGVQASRDVTVNCDSGKILKSQGSSTWACGDDSGASSGAPTDATYLVNSANGSLSAEIVVGFKGASRDLATVASNPTATMIPYFNASGDLEASSVASGDVTAVTLAGEDYLSLSGQQITAATISDTHMTAEDFGDFTCDSGEDGCLIDANSVALTTDTTGNYANGDGEAGNALAGDSATSFFSSGVLEVGIGGTGKTSVSDDAVLVGNSSANGYDLPALPSCSGSASKLLYNNTTNAWSCGTENRIFKGAVYLEDPVAADDLHPLERANASITINSIYCQTDTGTATIEINNDDGSVTGINGANMLCGSAGAVNSSVSGDTTLSSGDKISLDIVTVSGTPTVLFAQWYGTYD